MNSSTPTIVERQVVRRIIRARIAPDVEAGPLTLGTRGYMAGVTQDFGNDQAAGRTRDVATPFSAIWNMSFGFLGIQFGWAL
ncbi:MAG: hypothetical protein ABIT38_23995, partial [Gemmatimonadaceae bacterium]